MTFSDRFALLSCRLISKVLTRRNLLCASARKLLMDSNDEAKSTMEIVNIPPIVTTYRYALHTFDQNYKDEISTNLYKLKSLMDNLKADDLGYDQILSDPQTWRKPNKAPCTYIEVFQNSLVNMSVFILKPGFKMPLHDHPHMYGLLKVISGEVRIRSFTEYPLKEDVDFDDFAAHAMHEAARLAGFHNQRRLFAEVTQDHVCNASSQTCVLTPTNSNYHEIEALDVPAAFFDILSPPYDTLIEGIGPRRCRYYYVANEISSNVVELQETCAPACFFCDQAPYLGPLLV
ncbi:2-aminoethanethiol dioxygenase [Pararge aegeria]|uniref:Jg7617 protein n=3 Tax=Pararge aegeria TaxID=116150 RepID=A0A8S4RJ55_9NEOP|nr:2-aminoethanethiol dioxygenase [Pararge aegeria]CAH2235759.1 jg7617 [Pararge aegeria aegeria]